MPLESSWVGHLSAHVCRRQMADCQQHTHSTLSEGDHIFGMVLSSSGTHLCRCVGASEPAGQWGRLVPAETAAKSCWPAKRPKEDLRVVAKRQLGLPKVWCLYDRGREKERETVAPVATQRDQLADYYGQLLLPPLPKLQRQWSLSTPLLLPFRHLVASPPEQVCVFVCVCRWFLSAVCRRARFCRHQSVGRNCRQSFSWRDPGKWVSEWVSDTSHEPPLPDFIWLSPLPNYLTMSKWALCNWAVIVGGGGGGGGGGEVSL